MIAHFTWGRTAKQIRRALGDKQGPWLVSGQPELANRLSKLGAPAQACSQEEVGSVGDGTVLIWTHGHPPDVSQLRPYHALVLVGQGSRPEQSAAALRVGVRDLSQTTVGRYILTWGDINTH